MRRVSIRNLTQSPDRIEFEGFIGKTLVRFDPFVTCHLTWFDSHKLTGANVTFDAYYEYGIYIPSNGNILVEKDGVEFELEEF